MVAYGFMTVETLAICAAAVEHKRDRAGFRRTGAQACKTRPSPRRDQHRFFLKEISFFENVSSA
jgi:hypothetical protein